MPQEIYPGQVPDHLQTWDVEYIDIPLTLTATEQTTFRQIKEAELTSQGYTHHVLTQTLKEVRSGKPKTRRMWYILGSQYDDYLKTC